MLGPKIDFTRWRRINFRSTGSLLAAEFLHGLYQRHDPFMNPIRFCNTVVVFIPWQSSSYAPAAEWDLLGLRFGERILRHPDRMAGEIRRVVSEPRRRSHALADQLAVIDLAPLSDAELQDLLLDSHHVPLGEIYNVNMVQVEHALHVTLKSIIANEFPGNTAQRDAALAELIAASAAPGSAAQDMEFQELISKCRISGVTDPDDVEEELRKSVDRQRELGAAYGAETVSLEGLKHGFRELVSSAPWASEERRKGSGPAVARLGAREDVKRVIELLRLAEDVRDRNKRLLGRITQHRTALLNEISRRRKVSPDAVRLYMLEELMRLLADGIEVPSAIVAERQRRGVILSRTENAVLLDQKRVFELSESEAGDDSLSGLCASPGTWRGVARIVSSASDISQMHVGDVLVARGIDFDMAPLLLMAGAVVIEEGGLLSHAAVIARERRIPCLIDVAGATQVIEGGEMLSVEADLGTVTRTRSKAYDSVPTGVPRRVQNLPEIFCPLEKALDPQQFGWKAAWLATASCAGMPVPKDAMALSVASCRAIWLEGLDDRRGSLEAASESLAVHFGNRHLNLRSSSPLEGCGGRSAAGVFHSAVAVPPNSEAIMKGLQAVLASACGSAARSYFAERSGAEPLPIAVLITTYQFFSCLGKAVSEYEGTPDQVLVESFEGREYRGCPDSGGLLVTIPKERLRTPIVGGASIPHLWADLLKVARLVLTAEDLTGRAVEIEWGLQSGSPTLLQLRPLQENKS